MLLNRTFEQCDVQTLKWKMEGEFLGMNEHFSTDKGEYLQLWVEMK